MKRNANHLVFAILIWVSTSVTTAQTIALDDFDRTDEIPLSAIGNWRQLVGPNTPGSATLQNNHIESSNLEGIYYWEGAGTFDPTKQYARARVVQGIGEVGLVLLGAPGQGLMVTWASSVISPPSDNLYIFWYQDGEHGELAHEFMSIQPDDIIEAVLDGGTVYAKVNGVVVASVQNTTSLLPGNPGFYVNEPSVTLDDWEAGTPTSYTISGTITENGLGLNDVEIAASGGFSGSATSNGSGDYSIAGVPLNATGIVLTPSLSGHTMSPLSFTIAGPVTGNVTDQDFTSTPNNENALTINATFGSVTRSPDQSTYAFGTLVTLTPVADGGYHFVRWSGDVPAGHETDSPLLITMDNDRALTAIFVNNGITIASDNFNRADEIPLNVLGNWRQSVAGPYQPSSVNLENNHIASADLEGIYYWGGTGTFDPAKQYARARVDMGVSEVGLVLLGAPGQGLMVTWASHFLSPPNDNLYIYWYKDGDYGELAHEFVSIQADDIIDAVLDGGIVYARVNGVTVASVANTSPLVVGTPGFVTYQPGASLDDWEAGTPSSNNEFTLAINALNGTVTRDPDQATYTQGTTVTLTATPAIGFNFISWSGDASGTANPLVVTMSANKNITANFAIGLTTVYVSSTGNDATGNGTSLNPFQTIQKGINVIAPNDTVRVLAGTYVGAVAVNKSVVLIGSGPDTMTTIEAPVNFETSSSYNHSLPHFNIERAIVYIGASTPINVRMEGFTVDGKRRGPALSEGVAYAGILAERCTVTIVQNTIINVLPADSLGSTWEPNRLLNGRGIHVRGNGAVATISNNYLENINRFNILIDASDNGTLPSVVPVATVSDNTIVGKGQYNGGQKGIWFDSGAWGTISGNTLSNFDYSTPVIEPDRASCITVYGGNLDPAHRRIIVNNIMTASSFVNNKGIYIQGTKDSIADNIITGFRWGMEFHSANFPHASRNIITGGQIGFLAVSDIAGHNETITIGGSPSDKNTITGQLPYASGGFAISLGFRDPTDEISFRGPTAVDARYNDFGVYTDSEVQERIWDRADTTLIGGLQVANVLYSPYFVTSLPIQLASFTGVALHTGNVALTWITLSELNNYGFFIQRKRTNETQYVEIQNSFVGGHGTTNEPRTYTFNDATPGAGTWMYRLRQIDLDGSQHLTEPIQIDVMTSIGEESAPTSYALKQNYPNPFNPSTVIAFDLPSSVYTTVKIYNLLGEEIATPIEGLVETGRHTITWNASGLPSGVYLCKLTAGNFVETRKLMLMK